MGMGTAGTGPARRPIATLGRLLGGLALSALLAAAAPAALAAEKLAICYAALPAALVPLAQLQGFYAAEGLDVELRLQPSGEQALQAMWAGQCPLATAGDVPVVHASLQRSDFSIVAAISTYNNFEKIVVRSDRGIRGPADLRGRRIAVDEFTGAHFFLDVYLAAQGLGAQDVIKVYLPAQDVAPAFRRGDVDAAAHWEPTLQQLAQEFGTRAKVLSAPGLHTSPFLLVGGRDFLRENQALVERVLRALLRAERMGKAQPATAKALVAREYALAPGEVELLWPLHDLRVALDQSLLFILENTARWETNLMPPAQRPALPNYLDFISVDALLAVKPEAITLIR